ncbi:hypothetical protein KUTeg_020742 [Tegillarca granosa]|uniref:Histone deacetylase domain-containing protein n=1 Tax=Tegillarca granosa TaxID=220873 RepID=A0ABQ9EEA2_TEGGR|nr:hypothetical protein KUTeg_020742 [Tegillarca granosa]
MTKHQTFIEKKVSPLWTTPPPSTVSPSPSLVFSVSRRRRDKKAKDNLQTTKQSNLKSWVFKFIMTNVVYKEITLTQSSIHYLEYFKMQDSKLPDVYQNAGLSLGCTLDLVQHIIQGKAKNGMAIIRRLKNVGISKGSVNECKADLIKHLKVDIDEKKEKPPGHHAMYNEFCGYCFLNNVAIAAKQAVDHYGLKRVLVIDWDVHHGQGTQYFFYNDPRIPLMARILAGCTPGKPWQLAFTISPTL